MDCLGKTYWLFLKVLYLAKDPRMQVDPNKDTQYTPQSKLRWLFAIGKPVVWL